LLGADRRRRVHQSPTVQSALFPSEAQSSGRTHQ
jgi:hypothetical protein